MAIILISLISATISAKADSATYLYLNRHLGDNYLNRSKMLFEEILSEEPGNQEALWKMSRIYYTMGDRAESADEKIKYYEKGKELAEKLIDVNNNHPEGHFWLGVHLGRIGQARGVMKSLSMVPQIRREFEKTLDLDPEHTGAMDGLAVLYYELPGLFGGNLDRSIEYLNKAAEIDSNYSIIYIDMAKVFIKKKEYNRARESLKKVINMKNPAEPADYHLEDSLEAEKLLESIKER